MCKNGCLLGAIELFNDLKSYNLKLDIEAFNRVIDGLCKVGKLEMGAFWKTVPLRGSQLDVATYSIMIHGLCKEGQVEKVDGRKWLYIITYNTLLHGFCKGNKSKEVIEILHRMVQKDVSPSVITCTIVVGMLSKNEKYQECLDLLPRYPVQKRELIEHLLINSLRAIRLENS